MIPNETNNPSITSDSDSVSLTSNNLDSWIAVPIALSNPSASNLVALPPGTYRIKIRIDWEKGDGLENGPWSRWQGNLNTKILIIGQDWGDTKYFEQNKGFDKPDNPTNKFLIKLFKSIGFSIEAPSAIETRGAVFFTNAILCLKTEGGLQGKVKREWFNNCGKKFLKPLIELISPRIVITLGERAFYTVINLYNIPKPKLLRDVVEKNEGIYLSNNILLFPMYHCGQRILNTHRPFEQQIKDWARIKQYLD